MSVNLGRNAGTATPALWAGVTSREADEKPRSRNGGPPPAGPVLSERDHCEADAALRGVLGARDADLREELAAADAALCARLGFATFELEAGGASS